MTPTKNVQNPVLPAPPAAGGFSTKLSSLIRTQRVKKLRVNGPDKNAGAKQKVSQQWEFGAPISLHLMLSF